VNNKVNTLILLLYCKQLEEIHCIASINIALKVIENQGIKFENLHVLLMFPAYGEGDEDRIKNVWKVKLQIYSQFAKTIKTLNILGLIKEQKSQDSKDDVGLSSVDLAKLNDLFKLNVDIVIQNHLNKGTLKQVTNVLYPEVGNDYYNMWFIMLNKTLEEVCIMYNDPDKNSFNKHVW
jgi:hypothetical protein